MMPQDWGPVINDSFLAAVCPPQGGSARPHHTLGPAAQCAAAAAASAGRFLFLQYPVLQAAVAPILPFARLYFSSPIVSLVVFFGLYAGVINNRELPYAVRYNALQALLLDILLIVPSLLESTFRVQPGGGAGLSIYITGYNSIFLFIFVCVVYAVVRAPFHPRRTGAP